MFMMNAQESIYSVVQHLSPFSLNRNLPWQIYATRPKRFARPGPDQLMGAGGGSSYAGGAGQCLADPLAQAAAAAEQSSLYGLGDDAFDGGDSSVPHYHARAVLRSVYDKLAAPAAGRGGGGKLQQHGFCRRLTRGGRREEGGRALGRPLRTAARSRLVCCSPSARTTKSRASPTGGGVTSTTDEHAPLVSVCSTQVPRDS